MLGLQNTAKWIAAYSRHHKHPVNKLLHLVGIPSIALSLLLMVLSIFVAGVFGWSLALLAFGAALLAVGHVVEGKPPAFFKNWRFLFTGLGWWIAKMRGR